MTAEEAKAAQNVETVDDDDCPALETVEDDAAQPKGRQMPGAGKTNKRYLKAMQKMGLKPEAGVNRVVIKKTAAIVFAINQPEVYRYPNSNTYVIFGEASMDERASDTQRAAAEQFAAAPKATAAPADDENEAEEDATGVAEKDIELVMTQASVGRNKAIRALKNNDNDIVNAIMELTT